MAKDLIERYPVQVEEKVFPADIARWAEESYEIGLNEVYQGIENGFFVNSEYINRCKPIAERQLVLAAHRLAVILKDLLGD